MLTQLFLKENLKSISNFIILYMNYFILLVIILSSLIHYIQKRIFDPVESLKIIRILNEKNYYTMFLKEFIYLFGLVSISILITKLKSKNIMN